MIDAPVPPSNCKKCTPNYACRKHQADTSLTLDVLELRAEISRLRESNARLLEALKDAQCDLDAMKLLGQRLGSYETTRIKVRAAIAAAEGEK